MNSPCATVNNILPFSCVDGPGNRLTIFLQGCNFSCKNCHNPYTMGLCNHCADCVPACQHGALSIQQGKVVWYAQQCQSCDSCIQHCSQSATPMSHRYSVSQLLVQVRRYAPFINGITLSGGEATLQLPFIIALFTAIKQSDDLKHLTCFVDSNGYLSATGWHKLLPLLDGAMVDLKAWDNHVHQYLTGRDNHKVKASIELLAQAGKLYEVRLLLIKQHSDLEKQVAQLADYLLSLDPAIRIRINAFQHHGVKGEASQWVATTRADVNQFIAQLKQAGVTQIIPPALYLPSSP